jgi:hypothetical protein
MAACPAVGGRVLAWTPGLRRRCLEASKPPTTLWSPGLASLTRARAPVLHIPFMKPARGLAAVYPVFPGAVTAPTASLARKARNDSAQCETLMGPAPANQFFASLTTPAPPCSPPAGSAVLLLSSASTAVTVAPGYSYCYKASRHRCRSKPGFLAIAFDASVAIVVPLRPTMRVLSY